MSPKTKIFPKNTITAVSVLISILSASLLYANNKLPSFTSQIEVLGKQDVAQLTSESGSDISLYGSAIREIKDGIIILDVTVSVGPGDEYAAWFAKDDKRFFLGKMRSVAEVYTLNLTNGDKYLAYNELIVAKITSDNDMGKVILRGKFN